MKKSRSPNYTDRIRWRIRLLWVLIFAMLVYMVVVVELGGGDSRRMTELAAVTSRIIFFGGLIYVGTRIHHNRKTAERHGTFEGTAAAGNG